MEKIEKNLATIGPIGYFPAPGTMGTLIGLPIIAWINTYANNQPWTIIFLLTVIIFYIIKKALLTTDNCDPSEIIIDEVAGILVTLCGVDWSVSNYILGFLLFRFFDIAKPCGIKTIEKLPGAWGVLLDDCVAGFFAHILLRYTIYDISIFIRPVQLYYSHFISSIMSILS